MNDTSIAPAAETVPDFAGLIARIRHSVPQHCILSKVEDTRPYECDGLSLYRALPPVVVLPENEEQVVAVLQACKAFNIPIVARGAGTGLSGGAMPHAQGILLGLATLNSIHKNDPRTERKSVGEGKSVSVSVISGGRRYT